MSFVRRRRVYIILDIIISTRISFPFFLFLLYKYLVSYPITILIFTGIGLPLLIHYSIIIISSVLNTLRGVVLSNPPDIRDPCT